MNKIKFPATKTVHWPTGPVNCCENHARALAGLGRFMGSHIAVSTAPEGAECGNCKNATVERQESKYDDRGDCVAVSVED